MQTFRTKPVRAVLFDLDGTLVDTMSGFADLAADVMQNHLGLDPQWGRKRYLETSGIPFCKQLEVIAPGHGQNLIASDEFERRKLLVCESALMDETTRTGLESLQKLGLRLVVSSNTGQAVVEEFVVRENFAFDLALGFLPEQGLAKGEPHVSAVLSQFGLQREDLLFVGDSLMDGVLAKACRIRFVGRTGTFTREQFRGEFPESETVDAITQLVNLVKPLRQAA